MHHRPVTIVLLLLLAAAASAQGDGLLGRYYEGVDVLDGDIRCDSLPLAFERVDPEIDFWTLAPSRYRRWEPVPGAPDAYTVVWTGWILVPEAGEYAFGTIGDDGSQVWIDGLLVVDNGESQFWDWEDSLVEGSDSGIGPAGDGGAPEDFPGPLHLEPGAHAVEVRFFEGGVYDGIQFWWLRPGAGPSSIPYFGESFNSEPITVNPDTNWEIVPQEVLYSSEPVTAVPASGPATRLAAAPNPFNPVTSAVVDLARPGPVRLTVHDAAGRLVRTLFQGDAEAGPLARAWRGDDDAGRAVPSGVYVLRLKSADGVRTRKLTLAR